MVEELTLILLSYNRRHLIPSVLSSILNNNFPFQLIVIDNNSTDGAKQYLADRKDEMDILMLNNKNIGCVAFNDAIRAAKGKYVSIHADDHVLPPNWVEKMFNVTTTVEAKKKTGYVSSILHYLIPPKDAIEQLKKNVYTVDQLMAYPGAILNKWETSSESKSVRAVYNYGSVIYHEADAVGSGGTVIPMRTFKEIGLYRTYGIRGLYDGEFRWRCKFYNLSVGYTPNTFFLHVKENFINPERVKAAFASLHPTPEQQVQLTKDWNENIECAKLGIPPYTVPKL